MKYYLYKKHVKVRTSYQSFFVSRTKKFECYGCALNFILVFGGFFTMTTNAFIAVSRYFPGTYPFVVE